MVPSVRAAEYEFVRTLGEGSFGSVVLARHRPTGDLVAIKKMARESLHARYAESELINHSMLNHPHVVGFREVFLSPRNLNIVMEYADGGSLFAYVQRHRRLGEALARLFFQQLLFSVDYCHKKGVGHRDIKLENTLLAANPHPNGGYPLIKICDFGYSKHDARSNARSRVGTPSYMAPEVLHNADGQYDAKKADVWSCGVVLYTMLVGRYPFHAAGDDPAAPASVVAMYQRMVAKDYSLPSSLGLSGPCVALLARLLEPDAAARISIEEIMQDPWFATELPRGALSYNDTQLRAPRRCAQSEDAIRAIMAAATAEHAAGGPEP